MRRVGHQALGLEHGCRLDRLALGVDRVELARDLEGALGVLRHQQLEPGIGVVEATRRVDARREREPERPLVDALRIDARDSHQCPHAGALGARQRAQAAAHQRAVLAHQRHQVGDRCERDDVQLVVELGRIAAGRGEQGLRQLEGHARGAQVGRVAADSGMDHRAVRQHVAGPVMVGDDHVHAKRARVLDLLDRADAAVGGDEQARAASMQVFDRRARQAVAVVHAAGDRGRTSAPSRRSVRTRTAVEQTPSTS